MQRAANESRLKSRRDPNDQYLSLQAMTAKTGSAKPSTLASRRKLNATYRIGGML